MTSFLENLRGRLNERGRDETPFIDGILSHGGGLRGLLDWRREEGFPFITNNSNALMGFGMGMLGGGPSRSDAWASAFSGWSQGSQMDQQRRAQEQAAAEEQAREQALQQALGGIEGLPPWVGDLAAADPMLAAQFAAPYLQPQPGGGDEGLPTEVRQMRQEFNSLTEDARTVVSAYRRIQASAADPSGAGDMALIFNYMKMLDPNSTVREGEFATAARTGSLGSEIQGWVNSMVNGQLVDASVRADIVNRATRLYQASMEDYNSIAEPYRQLANEYGFEPDLVVVPFGFPDAGVAGYGPITENDPFGIR